MSAPTSAGRWKIENTGSLTKTKITAKLAQVIKALTKGLDVMDGVHIFTAHGDVPDDEGAALGAAAA